MKKKYKIMEIFLAFFIVFDIICAFTATCFAVIYMGDWFKSLMFFSVTLLCFFIAVIINIIISKLGF